MEIGENIYCKDCINEIITKSFGEKENNAPKETLTKKPAVEIEEPADNFEPIEPITPIQSEEREAEEEALKISDAFIEMLCVYHRPCLGFFIKLSH